ncbi:MAG TPA: hypothetical protein VK158_03340 [Acidobacteriota bacterium]|nr:hypothetical protein [Acidobacteriota bacterium]
MLEKIAAADTFVENSVWNLVDAHSYFIGGKENAAAFTMYLTSVGSYAVKYRDVDETLGVALQSGHIFLMYFLMKNGVRAAQHAFGGSSLSDAFDLGMTALQVSMKAVAYITIIKTIPSLAQQQYMAAAQAALFSISLYCLGLPLRAETKK